jgi:hypothetical protein
LLEVGDDGDMKMGILQNQSEKYVGCKFDE